MIDLHSHILPGLDDGARTLSDAVEMARLASDAGVTLIAGTPHVRDDYPTTPAAMEKALAQVRAAVAAAGSRLDVRGGGELSLERIIDMPPHVLRRFGLAGNPSYLLVEFPYSGWPLALPEIAFRLRIDGMTPVLAHPERNPEVQARPDLLRPLVDTGALVQVTAASIDGRFGKPAARTAAKLVADGLAHLIASDAHSGEMRGFEYEAATAAVGDPALATWLMYDMPRAITRDERLPPRPVHQEARFGLGRRRGPQTDV